MRKAVAYFRPKREAQVEDRLKDLDKENLFNHRWKGLDLDEATFSLRPLSLETSDFPPNRK